MTSTPRHSGVLFGAAYYAEYQQAGTLDRDLDLMVEAGFTVIRVGESVWSTWEPREGEFELDWLQPVLDGAHARGISVILGTPTYAVPPWLQVLHPEIAAERQTGVRAGWGARQEMDQSHPAYRFYAERIVRRIAERYAGHPAVVGWQVDNEPGNELPRNEQVFTRFLAWLQRRYGTVERLNEEWGLVYWSHRITEWSQLWRPDGNVQPQYDLEWRRFQGELADELIAWQAAVVREYARDDQFVTTCISYSRPQVADDRLVKSLDVTAGNPYYKMQDGLTLGVEIPREAGWWHTGVWALHQWGDRAFSSAQAPFLVTETNAQSIGGPWQNHPPFDGQIKQAALALVSRGARMVEYWHWHTLHFGVETYWGGVLPHSQRPGRIHREVAGLGAALKAIGGAVDGFEPASDVLMLWSTDTKWSFEGYPPLALPNGDPDPDSYLHLFDAHYRGLAESGAQVRIQHVEQFLAAGPAAVAAAHPVLVVPGLYVVDDETLAALSAYVEAGGHLVLGVRTAYGDRLARARREVAPAVLSASAGVWYEEYTNLDEPLAVQSSDPALELEPGSAGTRWSDVLIVDDADVVLRYAGVTEIGADAVLTTRAAGAGRVSYVATVPNPELSRSIARWLVPATAAREWSAADTVTVTTGSRPGRTDLAFVSNWSAHEAAVTPPSAVRDLETGEVLESGNTLTLGPRSAHVFEHVGGGHETSTPTS
ncbi:beta-galactosidase [Labedella gwakjiensis]|uniref:beta-galactosidase n=1 Tax=Labedella gwakjiensis TaxID=390269 RepID=A0A2P8GTH6_9MICO|nr:beta-galactosidase [Labedella gwakjiensis]PSL37276.1 beta-galactosidase [Labedella gwakjiensis]RUQ84603.1 beta-galactosidase [Labedella gwakjiensis]